MVRNLSIRLTMNRGYLKNYSWSLYGTCFGLRTKGWDLKGMGVIFSEYGVNQIF